MSNTVCKATLEISDDEGDNVATVRCELPEGHTEDHCESWVDPDGQRDVRVLWKDKVKR